jgi:hypothetical protein
MTTAIRPGDCVKVPDGRTARVRERAAGGYKVRLRRKTGKSHQFMTFARHDLERVDCPKGWMSPEGYNRYLEATPRKCVNEETDRVDERRNVRNGRPGRLVERERSRRGESGSSRESTAVP